MDCWIEVDFEGKKTILGDNLGKLRKASDPKGMTGEQPSGYLLWVRRKENGKEVWDLALNSISIAPDGKSEGSNRIRGISPPPPPSPAKYFGSMGCGGGPLFVGRENTLSVISVMTQDDPGLKLPSTWTAKLKCRLMK